MRLGDPLTDPRRLPSLEQYALANCVATPYGLREGLIDKDGTLTAKGARALKEDAQARHDDALQRNMVSSLSASHMIILGKLIRSEDLTDDEAREARDLFISPMVDRDKWGRVTGINSFGRKVYGLAAGRTY